VLVVSAGSLLHTPYLSHKLLYLSAGHFLIPMLHFYLLAPVLLLLLFELPCFLEFLCIMSLSCLRELDCPLELQHVFLEPQHLNDFLRLLVSSLLPLRLQT
jgi:hypothetical protein